MKLIIDTRNGIAGDIVCAGLIGLGADVQGMIRSMEHAARSIGSAQVTPAFAKDTVSLDISFSFAGSQLTESHAREHLAEVMADLEFTDPHRRMGERILGVLCDAERYVHSTDPRLKHMLLGHHTHHLRSHHVPPDKLETVLHESQDILCDITGFITGLRSVDIGEVHYLNYVNVGNGRVTFSHGIFPVPAPATQRILDEHHIPWLRSDDHQQEMSTPTGVSILAGSRATKITGLDGFSVVKEAKASGTRYGLPPVRFYLAE